MLDHRLSALTATANTKAIIVASPKDTSSCHCAQKCLGTVPQLQPSRGHSPPQKQLGVVLALQVLLNKVGQELFQHPCGILHLALQRCHDERGHVAAVPHGEAPLGLQSTDEGQQEVLLVQELTKEGQGLLHISLDLQG